MCVVCGACVHVCVCVRVCLCVFVRQMERDKDRKTDIEKRGKGGKKREGERTVFSFIYDVKYTHYVKKFTYSGTTLYYRLSLFLSLSLIKSMCTTK